MAEEFDITEKLDSELDEILRGRAVYAGSGGDTGVTPLLELASALSGTLKADIPAQPPAAVRESLLARAQSVIDAAPPRRARPLRRLVLRPAALAAVLLAASAGTALAANAAGPDSILYPLKQELENARSLIAAGPLDRAAVKVGDAGKRLDEIQGMVDKREPQYVSSLLSAYDGDMADAQKLVAQAAAAGDNTAAVTGMIDATRARHDALLAEISGKVPVNVRSVIRKEEGQDTNGHPAAAGGQSGAPAGGMSGGGNAGNPAGGSGNGSHGGMNGGNGGGSTSNSGQAQGGGSSVEPAAPGEPGEPADPGEPAPGGMQQGGRSGIQSSSGRPVSGSGSHENEGGNQDGMFSQNSSLGNGNSGSIGTASGMSVPHR